MKQGTEDTGTKLFTVVHAFFTTASTPGHILILWTLYVTLVTLRPLLAGVYQNTTECKKVWLCHHCREIDFRAVASHSALVLFTPNVGLSILVVMEGCVRATQSFLHTLKHSPSTSHKVACSSVFVFITSQFTANKLNPGGVWRSVSLLGRFPLTFSVWACHCEICIPALDLIRLTCMRLCLQMCVCVVVLNLPVCTSIILTLFACSCSYETQCKSRPTYVINCLSFPKLHLKGRLWAWLFRLLYYIFDSQSPIVLPSDF